jgi:hypothetical protein
VVIYKGVDRIHLWMWFGIHITQHYLNTNLNPDHWAYTSIQQIVVTLEEW